MHSMHFDMCEVLHKCNKLLLQLNGGRKNVCVAKNSQYMCALS